MSEVKRWNHTTIHQNSDDVESSMITNSRGCYVMYDDYATLKAQRDALVAEVVNIREQAEDVYAAGYNHGHLNTVDGIAYAPGIKDEFYPNALQVMLEVETPATDAYLNSVRADVVKDFCQLVGQYGKVEPQHFNDDFADLYAKINKEIYESILDNPAVYDMENLVDWLERSVNDSRAYADMSIQHAAKLRAGQS